jgi:hypothetical protein
MKTGFLLLIALVVAIGIYWLVEWEQQHPDGE